MTTHNTDSLVSEGPSHPLADDFMASRRPVITEIQAVYTKHLTEWLQKLLALVDDELFKRSEKTGSSTQQALYFGAMRHFRVHADELRSNIRRQIDEGYDDFWINYHPPLFAEEFSGFSTGLIKPDFSQMENEILEEEIAVSAMVEKGNTIFHDSLCGLNRRFAFLLGQDDIALEDNPLSPGAICKAFCAVLKSLSSELTITLLVYKLLEHVVLGSLGDLYLELNSLLADEGILPSLPKNIKRPGVIETGLFGAGGTAAASPKERTGQAVEESQPAHMEVFQEMQQLIAGWQAEKSFLSNEASGGQIADARMVLDALNLLQSPHAGNPAYLASSEELKLYIVDQLSRIQPGKDCRLGRSEEDIIDMVALIFDFILEDEQMPDVVKGLIARLQIPVIKVAIIEKPFFGRKNHPVRLLLNALAQAGSGISSDEEAVTAPIFEKIDGVVNRILNEFDQNVDIFSDLLDEFMTFLEKDNQHSRDMEERTRQIIQSKEQVHLAKRKIAYEIATRLEGKGTPAAVRAFLYNAWKDVLVLAYLRREKLPGEWVTALAVMDKLIWSVLPAKDEATRRAIVHTIPKLLQAIRAGLEGLSMDPVSISKTIKGLETCHLARLSPALQGDHGDVEAQQGLFAAEEDLAIEIRDPEFAQAINEIRHNLPDVENFSVLDLACLQEDRGKRKNRSDVAVQGEAFFKVRELEIGQWLEFDNGRRKLRGKLSWKSEVTSTYVFINKKGEIVLEIAMSDLAERIQDNTARVINDISAPLFDRAFGVLANQLKPAVAKPV